MGNPSERHCVPDSSKVNRERTRQCPFKKIDFFSLIFQIKFSNLDLENTEICPKYNFVTLWDTVSIIINKIISDI